LSRPNKMPTPAVQSPVKASVAQEPAQAPVEGSVPVEAEQPPVEAKKVEAKKVELKFPLKVVALRDGFYKQVRIKTGVEFVCEKPNHLGKWMKPVK